MAALLADECRHIFHDGGVVLIFVVGTLLYPLIFGAIYKNEMVRDVPVAVVDEARCAESRRIARSIDATPEIDVRYDCQTMEEARRLIGDRAIRGIVYFPHDFVQQIGSRETARIALFCDMTSFLYYRSVYSGASAVLVDEMRDIQLQRYALAGLAGEDAEKVVATLPYDDVKLFCPSGGFTSFLVPALLVLVLHQTLFLGMTIICGTRYEERRAGRNAKGGQAPYLRRGSLWSAMRDECVCGMPYLLLYLALSAIVLVIIPRAFALPHIGRLSDLALFAIPFLLATIYFSRTLSQFIRHRDGGLLCCIFFSVILLFLSGTVWPRSNMPWVWSCFSYLFPYTPASQCFIAINSMGSHLSDIPLPYLLLWGQALFYFAASSVIAYVRSQKNIACTIITPGNALIKS